jgi:hypothetical protein
LSAALNGSVVSIDLGGYQYPYRSEPRCRVCTSPQRRAAEEMLASGRTYMMIAKALPDGGFDARNLGDHIRNGHLPLHAPAVRRVAQHEAADVKQFVEPAVQSVADHLSFASGVVARVKERMSAGEVQPTVGDGIAAAKLLAQTEAAASNHRTVDDYVTALLTLIDTVREHVTAETFTNIGRALVRDPMFRDLADRPHEP